MRIIIAAGKRWLQGTGDLGFRRGYTGIPLGSSPGATDLTGWAGAAGPVDYRWIGRFPLALDAAYNRRWLPAGYWGTPAGPVGTVIPWHLFFREVH